MLLIHDLTFLDKHGFLLKGQNFIDYISEPLFSKMTSSVNTYLHDLTFWEKTSLGIEYVIYMWACMRPLYVCYINTTYLNLNEWHIPLVDSLC